MGISSEQIALSDGLMWQIYYYKPPGYNEINSPIIFGVHGQNSTGMSQINDLINIADRRNALIVAPTFQSSQWVNAMSNSVWLPQIFKEIYRNVLTRESRDSIWVHLIGFSAGAQCVSRYMLVRQAIPDSIPIKMAVSSNAYFYTFGTDSLNGVQMTYPCGVYPDYNLDFTCTEHIKKYYNENYAVLIGSADISGAPATWPCMIQQGANRYERAINFFSYSQNDAISRGTELKWLFAEIPGVSHNQSLMYNTILTGDSISLSERLLFCSPYHSSIDFPPSADFLCELIDSISCTTIKYHPLCACQTHPVSFKWIFGDNDSSSQMKPHHTYLSSGIYYVSLEIENIIGTEVTSKYLYVGSNNKITGNFGISVSPNPVCPGKPVYLSCFNSIADNYTWAFGDSSYSTNLYNTNHIYTNEGDFEISLTLGRNCYSDTTIHDTVSVITGLPLSGSFSMNAYDPPVCYGGIVYFNAISSNVLDTYSWDFGDGFGSVGKYTSHLFADTGIFNVELTIESCGNDTVLSELVLINDDIEPELWWEYWPSKYQTCTNDSISFWGWNTGGNYFWDFGDGTTTSVSVDSLSSWGWYYKISKHAYSQPGNYRVKFDYVTNCGMFSDSFYVFIKAANADFSTNTDTICVGESFYFTSTGTTSPLWDFGDSTFDTIQNPVHSFLQEGEYIVTLTDINGNCIDTSSITVSCISPVAEFFQSKDTVDLSVSGQVQFTDLSNFAYCWFWDFGDGNFDSVANPAHEYLTLGTYHVTLFINSGLCSDTASSTMTVIDVLGDNKKDHANSLCSIYPNPSNGFFNIYCHGEIIKKIEIFELTGRIIEEKDIHFSRNIAHCRIKKQLNDFVIIKILTNENVYIIKHLTLDNIK